MLLKRLLLFALLGAMPRPLGLIVLSLAELLDFVLLFYLVLIFGWSLLSMFAVDRRNHCCGWPEALSNRCCAR